MSDDNTNFSRLAIFAEDALMPLCAFKEMLLNLDDIGHAGPSVDPAHIGSILESLLKQAESQFDAAEEALDKHIGHIQFIRARANYSGAATGKIVGVTLEPKEAAHVEFQHENA